MVGTLPYKPSSTRIGLEHVAHLVALQVVQLSRCPGDSSGAPAPNDAATSARAAAGGAVAAPGRVGEVAGSQPRRAWGGGTGVGVEHSLLISPASSLIVQRRREGICSSVSCQHQCH